MVITLEKRLQNKYISMAAIALLALLVYSNSFTAPFTLDDFGSIVNNYAIRNPMDIAAIWKFYSNRFVLYYTLSINYYLHDTAVAGYHITNLLIHILNGILVYLIFLNLLSLDCFKNRVTGRFRHLLSTLSALISVCHPMQVNAVTYIVQRTASLASTFYFLAIYFFLKYRMKDKLTYYFLTLLFTIVAMFTKENTITIPFLLALIEFMFFLRDGKTSWAKRILFLIPLFMTVPIIPGTNLLLKGYSQSDPGVSFKASTSMARSVYFYTQLNVIVHYIRLLIFPDKQNFDYSNDYPLSHTLWENHSYCSFMILAVIGLIGLANFRRNKLISMGILWFFIGLSVESSFISIKDVYFEHRVYFPVAGFVMFVIGLVFDEFKSFRSYTFFNKRMKYSILFLCILIIAYSGLTLRRNYIYSDGIRLWSDVVKRAPRSDRAHSVLGSNYLDAYEYNEVKKEEYLDFAELELKKAIELDPSNDTAHCNLSKVYVLKKQYEKAIEEANAANEISRSTYSYHNLGNAYKALNQTREAIEAYLAGYRLDNKCTFILKALGNVYYEINDDENAKFYYQEFLKYNIFSDNKEVQEKLDIIKAQRH